VTARLRLRVLVLALVCAALALPGTARAAVGAGGYASHVWAGCGGGFNSGSWDAAGRVYVPCGSPSVIGVYDTTGALVDRINVPFQVTDVAPSRDGQIVYLAGASGGRRAVRSAAGTWSVDAWKPATYSLYGKQTPAGGYYVAADAEGNVYFADGMWATSSAHMVVKYRADGSLVTTFGEWDRSWRLGAFYWGLGGLAVSADGATVFTSEVGNNRLQRWARGATGAYTPAAAFGGTEANNADRGGYCQWDGWLGAFAAPYDVALDAADNVYVINTTCKQVLKFAPGPGALLAIVDVRVNGGDYPRPHGFAVGADGAVYVGENQRMMRPAGGALPANGLPPGAAMSTTPPTQPPTSPPVASTPPPPARAGTAAAAPAATTTTPGVSGSSAPDTLAPSLRLTLALVPVRRIGRTRALTAELSCSERCRIEAIVRDARGVIVGRRVAWLPPRTTTRASPLRMMLGARARPGHARLTLTVRDSAGNARIFGRIVTISR